MSILKKIEDMGKFMPRRRLYYLCMIELPSDKKRMREMLLMFTSTSEASGLMLTTGGPLLGNLKSLRTLLCRISTRVPINAKHPEAF